MLKIESIIWFYSQFNLLLLPSTSIDRVDFDSIARIIRNRNKLSQMEKVYNKSNRCTTAISSKKTTHFKPF
jgi:hypothetical protein